MQNTENNTIRAGRLFSAVSLGCKVNQAEIAYIAEELGALGYTRADEGDQAELVLLHTCAVTASAARQSRQMARRLARQHPQAKIIVTGCDVHAEAKSYLDQGFTVLGRSDLADVGAMAAGETPWPCAGEPAPPDSGRFCPGMILPGHGRSRAVLKVQDGCQAFCAYCIVPYTRGRQRSLPLKQAAAQFAELGRAGAREVVLTGIHLGRYGLDISAKPSLCDLIRTLIDAHPLPRIRLSSLESAEINQDLIQLLASEKRLCRHLHVPLQSGCDKVLKSMGRPYTVSQFKEQILAANSAVPGICLGADVLMGLPGEDETAFEQTRELLFGLPISYLHVFPYSPRPGTRACAMPGRPRGDEVRKRAALLRELGAKKRKAFAMSQIGQELEAVVEGSGLARSDNYCLLQTGEDMKPGGIIRARATGLLEGSGEPVLTAELTG